MLVVKCFHKSHFDFYIDFRFCHTYIQMKNDLRVAKNGIE